MSGKGGGSRGVVVAVAVVAVAAAGWFIVKPMMDGAATRSAFEEDAVRAISDAELLERYSGITSGLAELRASGGASEKVLNEIAEQERQFAAEIERRGLTPPAKDS